MKLQVRFFFTLNFSIYIKHYLHLCCQPVWQIQVDENGKIVDARFKTFGCGSAIASSSLATEWVKGKSVSHCDSDHCINSQIIVWSDYLIVLYIYSPVVLPTFKCSLFCVQIDEALKSKTLRLPKNFVYLQSNFIALVSVSKWLFEIVNTLMA